MFHDESLSNKDSVTKSQHQHWAIRNHKLNKMQAKKFTLTEFQAGRKKVPSNPCVMKSKNKVRYSLPKE